MKKSTKITILVGVLFVVGLLAMSYLYNPTPHITTPEKDAQLLANEAMDKVRKRTIETIPIDEQHDVFEEESTQSYKEKQFIQVKEIIEKELTEREKEIFELKELDGLSIIEIAERFELTEGAVKMCLSRARKKIRDCYRKEGEDE